MLITKPSDRLEERLVGGDHAPLSLNRLNNHRTDIIAESLGQRLGIVKRKVLDRAGQGPKALTIIGLPPSGYRKKCPSMKCILKRQDPVFFFAMMVEGVPPSKFESGFVGFGTRVAEEDPIRKSEFHQPPGQL